MATSDYTPATADVASYLRVRTKDRHGNEIGDFNADTRPTNAQVAALIPKGVRRLSARIGTEICEGDDANVQAELYSDAKDLAALYVAMQIELSYFAEQVGSSRSPYEQLKELYDDGMKVLLEAIAEHCGGGGGLAVGGRGAKPAHSFPDVWPVGRNTEW